MPDSPRSRRVDGVSVIIPAWNAAGTVAHTLASLQAQHFQAWEAVVVDDGSTDDTSAVVAAVATNEPRISLVRRETSGGAAAARNLGLERITRRWVLFLDADDWILPGHLARLADLLDASPEADAAVCGWTLVRDGRAIESEYCRAEGDLFPVLARRPAFAIHTCLIDRTRVEAVGGFDVQCVVHQDWQLWQRVARGGARFAVIREPLAVYRLHEGSITGDQSRLAAEALDVIALGHACDPRVPNPLPRHAEGRPLHELTDAQVTHLAWPAGIEIARGTDARPLFEGIAEGTALGAADHIGPIIARAAATYTDPAILTSPERWPQVDRHLGDLLERLAGLTGDPHLPRAARLGFERHMLATSGEARTLSLLATVTVDVTAPIEDVTPAGHVERVRIAVTAEGDPLGVIELPVIDGQVRAAVVRDAIASRFAWPILGRFFSNTVYASFRMERHAGGWRAWRGTKRLCGGLPDDAGERQAVLHDRVGWELFLDEVWHSTGPFDWLRRLARAGRRSADPPSGSAVAVEVGEPLPAVRHASVALYAGGALVTIVPRGTVDAATSGLRAALTDAAGFELCRVVVREALLGTPLTLGSLGTRLAHAAARRKAAASSAREEMHAEMHDRDLVPGSHRAAALATAAGASLVLARHESEDPFFGTCRLADLPRESAGAVRSLARAERTPLLGSGDGRGPIAYDPGVAAVPRAPAASASARPRGESDSSSRAFGRHHFERQFAVTADPWRYEAPYERRKYDQTLALIGDARAQRCLEAGSAEGHFTVRLAARADQVIAADISEIALTRVEARCAAEGIRNVRTRRLDLAVDPLPGECDLVVCSEVLYYMGDRGALAAVARRLAAALVPGGALVTAHAHVLSDAPDESGFDWGLPYGAKTIGETFQSVPGLVLEHEIRTPLYRIQRFRRLPNGSRAVDPVVEVVPNDVLPTGPTASGMRLDGSRRVLPPPPPVSTSRLPILMYHRISPAAAPERARYTLSPDVFEAQLAYLRDSGFRSAMPDEWAAAAAARRPLDGRRVMLTFDDAYEDFGTTAWPLLRRYGFQAVLFAVTGYVGRRNAWDPDGRDERLLDWPDLEDLVRDGVRVGSHTVSHARLTSCSAREITDELARSRAELIDRLGVAADAVAYPWGGEDAAVHHLAGACGYVAGFTCRWGTAGAADEMLALPRLEVGGDISFDTFVKLLDP